MLASRFVSLGLVLAVGVVACRPPRITTLPGAAAPGRALPSVPLPSGHRKIVFDWEMRDEDMTARGEGVARIAFPDSVRLDFFVGGGYGNGAAILIGDSLAVPGPDIARRLVPPRALLWAALGHLVLPPERDTVVRVDGETLRADIGSPVHWRVSYRGDTLTRLERVDGGRIHESVERSTGQRVQYRHASTGRTLSLVIRRTDAVSPFDRAIWRF